ncbi:MAG TPA: orotidine 5'-phosphate decarboxylase, partial [Chloroflexi bacterium]|nr:orotidine 5'-phosphate decarboxylase [Chloroflexota bacterium]
MTFLHKLCLAQETNRSWLCIGLDPAPDRMPPTLP